MTACAQATSLPEALLGTFLALALLLMYAAARAAYTVRRRRRRRRQQAAVERVLHEPAPDDPRLPRGPWLGRGPQ